MTQITHPAIAASSMTPVRWVMLAVMVVFYAAAGVVHLASPDAFLPIVPDWVPSPRFVVMLTGVCELAGAAGLLTGRFRWWAGVMLALYAFCVFPANIKHALEGIVVPQLPQSWWYHGPRLLAQPVIIWWALFCSGVITWPFSRRSGETKA
ncbi:DoxX family protein [Lichenihabitans sp. PAMC28606]|uniref:DoxX family protein n=1 Tax=Lichenihabitans sp. PAMC28606 TaxID=2880932 RepID=UPI0039B40DBD